jgi:hypothetical protein
MGAANEMAKWGHSGFPVCWHHLSASPGIRECPLFASRCEREGSPLREWAESALEERGVRALRLIQGVLGLTHLHPRERVLAAAQTPTVHRLFRYKDLQRLT